MENYLKSNELEELIMVAYDSEFTLKRKITKLKEHSVIHLKMQRKI